MPEPEADLVDQLRNNALRAFNRHVQVDGACVHCGTSGVCDRARLAANNLDLVSSAGPEVGTAGRVLAP